MADPEFEWDENKARQNLEKHGIDFNDACEIFFGPTSEWPDTRRDYGERRFIAVGAIDGRELVVVYTWRKNVRRLISARRADVNEREAYREALAGSAGAREE